MRTIQIMTGLLVVTSAQIVHDQGGAQINEPFQRKVIGAVCSAGTHKQKGTVFFNFPDQGQQALTFAIGPGVQGQEKNEKFTGPGEYHNIGISVKSEDNYYVSGYGKIVVNDDRQSGFFAFHCPGCAKGEEDDDEAVASGTWDCGRKLKH